MNSAEIAALDHALTIARSGNGDPASAVVKLGQVGDILGTVQPRWQRRTSLAQRIIIRKFAVAVTVNAGVVTQSSTEKVYFPGNGRIVGVRGIVREGDTLLSHVDVSIQLSDSRYLGTDGKVEAAIPLSILNANPQYVQQWLGLDNAVSSSDTWQVYCTSADTAGTTTYTPVLAFLFEPDLNAQQYPQS